MGGSHAGAGGEGGRVGAQMRGLTPHGGVSAAGRRGPGVGLARRGVAVPAAHTSPGPERLGRDQRWFPDVGLPSGPAVSRLLI